MSPHLKAHSLISDQLQQEVGALPLTWTFFWRLSRQPQGFVLTACCTMNTLLEVDLGKANFSAHLQSTSSARRISLKLGQ